MDRCLTMPDLVNGLGNRSCRKTRCVYRRPSILRRARLTLWQRNRFFFTLLPSLVLGANTLFAQAPTSSAVEHPNVLFIAIDDLRPALGCYGDPLAKSPNIDHFAKSARQFNRAYVQQAVCGPSRTSLLTGLLPDHTQVWHNRNRFRETRPDHVTLPLFFKQHGYRALGLGKIFSGNEKELDPISWLEPEVLRRKPIKEEGYLTTRITEETVDFTHRHKEEPFFLYVAYNAVHAPPEAPEKDIKEVTGDETRDILMAMIKHLDMGVGEIVNSLKKHDIFDNTLLIFLTDNGGSGAMHANNAPLRGFKQMDYEGGIHVPFIVSWPAQLEGGRKCDVPMWSIDLFATALDAAGLPMPKDKPLDGKSILPALKGETDNLHNEMYWSSAGASGKWAIRSGNWKLVAEKDRIELFDLEKDLSETTDLAAKHPKVVSELRDEYNAWLDKMADPVSKQEKRWNPDSGAPAKRMSKEEKKAARIKAREAKKSGQTPESSK